MEIINDSQWINGLDSMSYTLGQGSYQWAQNVVNRGGIVGTRQGFAEVASIAEKDPRGIGVITISGVTWMLAAIGENIYKLNLNNPSAGLQILNYPHPPNPLNTPVVFPIGNRRMVHFELCVQAQESLKTNDGYVTRNIPTPKFVLIIQDGVTPPHYWDGVKCDKIDNLYPDSKPNNTPKGSFMKWAGDRLWTISGRKVRASNLLNPFQNTEELVTASGGFFFIPDNVTGIGVTHDFKSLLVFSHFTTSAFQVGIEDRTAWPDTQDFQRVIFPSIGCVSHRTIINMYGMTWWMAHDGWVGLDNTLSAYQSSRLDIQDQNMSRSKEGINWSTGGGCSGSYGNFLFVSVPSANKWNQHTWVLDQSPINTVTGQSPPAWASNWTGIRPEQWVTCQINGHQRCFCISRDLTNEGHQSTVWEAFIGQRMDVPKDGSERKAKDIACAFESKFSGLSPSQYMKLRWIELDCAEIIGDVSLQVYYCGRRTSYKKIVDTHLTSTISNSTDEVFNPEEPIKVNVPQFRTVRSVTDVHEEDDNDTEVQTPYNRNKDREFSVIVQWTGQMAVSAIRYAVDPEPDYMEGTVYEDEYLARRITAEGTGGIGCTLPPPNTPTGKLTSQFIAPLRPRWVEFPAYDSAVPNGVFFVSELTASPPPGAYPSNFYPVDINLTSETQGIEIYYTRDGTRPHGPPNQHGSHYPTPKPHITVGQTLKAVGERDGLLPSVILQGQYTQIRCEDVVFDPPAGGYPPDTFAQPNPPEQLAPAAAYNFNEGTGTIAHDVSGNGIDGTLQNGATWNTTGKHGKALSLDGVNDYVYLGNPPILRLAGSSTWSAWVKATANPSGDAAVISKSDVSTGWELKTVNISGSHKFQIQIASAHNTFVNRTSVTARSLNTWYFVTGVYDAHAHTLDIYVNGVLDNGTLTGTITGSQVNSPANVSIGRARGQAYWTGLIDDLRVYSRAISAAEVMTDMNTPVGASQIQSGFPVHMSTATAEATIHFNIGGGTVTEAQQEYDPAHPPHPYAGDQINAKAFRQYYLPSNQTHALYTAVPRCVLPTTTPDGGSYHASDYNEPTGMAIAMSSGTQGAQLRFTINDTDVEHGTVVANPHTVHVHPQDTLRVIAQKTGHSDSLVKTSVYTTLIEQVETPVITPDAVILSGNVHEFDVSVSCATTGASMRYVIVLPGDNTQPTRDIGTLISSNTATIHIGPPDHRIGHQVLRIIAYRTDMDDSDVAEGTYDYEAGGGG
jgi:hypothetical protein